MAAVDFASTIPWCRTKTNVCEEGKRRGDVVERRGIALVCYFSDFPFGILL